VTQIVRQLERWRGVHGLETIDGGLLDTGVIGKLLVCVCFLVNLVGWGSLNSAACYRLIGACLVIITNHYTISFKTPSSIPTGCCKPLVKCSRRAPRFLVRRYYYILLFIFHSNDVQLAGRPFSLSRVKRVPIRMRR